MQIIGGARPPCPPPPPYSYGPERAFASFPTQRIEVKEIGLLACLDASACGFNEYVYEYAISSKIACAGPFKNMR